jgi:DNA-binding MarR family transcriptional regulator
VLTVIEHNPGLSQTQVCDALGIQKANFVAVLDHLVGCGWVTRKPAPNDRRSYALVLTSAGKLLMNKLHRIAEQHEQRLIERLGAANYGLAFSSLRELASMDRDPHGNDASR